MLTQFMDLVGKGMGDGNGIGPKGKAQLSGSAQTGKSQSGEGADRAFLENVIEMAEAQNIAPQKLLELLLRMDSPETLDALITKLKKMLAEMAVRQGEAQPGTPVEADGSGESGETVFLPLQMPSAEAETPALEGKIPRPASPVSELSAVEGVAISSEGKRHVADSWTPSDLKLQSMASPDLLMSEAGQRLWQTLQQQQQTDGSPAGMEAGKSGELMPQSPWVQTGGTQTASVDTPPPASPVPFELKESDVIQQMIDKARIGLNEGKPEIRVSLHPPELGRVHLQIVSEHSHVTVKIITEVPLVRDVVESHVQQLRNELTNQGLQVSKIDVELQSEFQENRQQEAASDPRKRDSDGGAMGEAAVGDAPAVEGTATRSPAVAAMSGRVDFFA